MKGIPILGTIGGPGASSKLDSLPKRILALLSRHRELSTSSIASMIDGGGRQRAVAAALEELSGAGAIVPRRRRIGTRDGRPLVGTFWRLTPEG